MDFSCRRWSSENVFRPELKGEVSMIRELHVYGSAIPVHSRDPSQFQHKVLRSPVLDLVGLRYAADGGSRANREGRALFHQNRRHLRSGYPTLLPQARLSPRRTLHVKGTLLGRFSLCFCVYVAFFMCLCHSILLRCVYLHSKQTSLLLCRIGEIVQWEVN